MKSTALLLLIFLMLAACAEPSQNDEQAAGDTAYAHSDTAGTVRPGGELGVDLAALVEARLNPEPGTERLSLLDSLAPPLRVETEPTENRHVPGQIDTLRTLHYDGLRLTLYDVSASESVILTEIEVTGEQHALREGLRVGDARQAVEDALGPPDERENGTYVYEYGNGASHYLRLYFSGDAVFEIEWSFYYD